MKAAACDVAGDPEVLRHVNVPDPACAEDGLLVRVKAISVEGGDTIRRATAPPPHPAYVVGYAAAGEIVEIGRDVRGFRIGQVVATIAMEGSHAALRAAPASVRSSVVSASVTLLVLAIVGAASRLPLPVTGIFRGFSADSDEDEGTRRIGRACIYEYS